MDEPHHVGLVRATLSSMDVEEYDESVIQQLLELLYRHVHKTSATAMSIARHSSRESANEEDVKLAIRMLRPFGNPPHLMAKEIASEVNKQPFAPVSSKLGVTLPTERALTTRNYDVVISRNRAPGPWPELFPPVVRPRRRKPRNIAIQRRIKLTAPTSSTTDVHSSASAGVAADRRVITGSRAQAISIMRSPFTANATQTQATTVPTIGRPNFKPSTRVNTATHANMPDPPPLRTPTQEPPAPDTRYRAAIPKTAFELDTSLLLNHHASKRATPPKTIVDSARKQSSKIPTPVPARASRTPPPRATVRDRTRTTESVPQIASRLQPTMLAPSEPRLSNKKAKVSVRSIRPRTPEPIQQVRETGPEITNKKAIGKVPKLGVRIPKRPAPRIQSSDSDDFSDLVNSMPRASSAIAPTRKSTTLSKLALARKIQESSSEHEVDSKEEPEQNESNVSDSNHPKRLKTSPFTGPRKSSAWLLRDVVEKPVSRNASNDSPATRRGIIQDGNRWSVPRRDNTVQVANQRSGQRAIFNDNTKRSTKRDLSHASNWPNPTKVVERRHSLSSGIRNVAGSRPASRRRYSEGDIEKVTPSKGTPKTGARNERRNRSRDKSADVDVRAHLRKLMLMKNITPEKPAPARLSRDSSVKPRTGSSSAVGRGAANKPKKAPIEIIEID